jgi:3'-phosphoadenosine 5'-phosphosulfate sulfotransferase (PAPS reductase)/FAD synthetase
MSDPFKVEGPAIISFSGGRTSGYMLYRIIAAYGGALPDDVRVAFCNTGREMPETLDFVRDCGAAWGVEIAWLEYRSRSVEPRYAVVDHARAARAGEPFARAIAERGYLPNPVTRFCTAELKVKTTERWAKGTLGWQEWTSVVGFRADEPRRVARMRARGESSKGAWDTAMPLADAGVMRDEVTAFWQGRNFDLRLTNRRGVTPLGNCDLCFLKNTRTRIEIMRSRPDLAAWWIEQEASVSPAKPDGARFRKDVPDYETLARLARDQGVFDLGDEPMVDCHCTEDG